MTKLRAAKYRYYLLHTDAGIRRRLPGEPPTEAAIGVLLRTRHLVQVGSHLEGHRPRERSGASHETTCLEASVVTQVALVPRGR